MQTNFQKIGNFEKRSDKFFKKLKIQENLFAIFFKNKKLRKTY